MKQIRYDDAYREILLTITLLKDLQENIKRELIEKLDVLVYEIPKGETVIKQGSICRKLYVLLKGKLRVDMIDVNGNDILIEYIEAPRAFATPLLFNEDARFPATFTAVEDNILLTASKESAFNVFCEYPEILKRFLNIAGKCNVCTTVRLDILSRKTIRERLLVYFFKHKKKEDFVVSMMHSQIQLAQYLNVSRPALSTEINKLEKEGLIKRKGKNRIELNLKELREPM